MRYLRMLSNAVVGGLLGATYLVVLVLQINPQVPTVSMTTAHWFVALVTFYGLYASVAIYLLILVLDVLSPEPLRPAWFSVRLLSWIGAACAAAGAAVMWGNLASFRAVLGEGAAQRMREGAVATTVFAVVLAAVAVLRVSVGRRASRPAAAMLVAAMGLSVVMPLWSRGPGDLPAPAPRLVLPKLPLPAQRPRIRLLLLDGASLGFIRQRVAVGQLPNFGRVLYFGTAVDLAALKPTQAVPIWAAAATGKYAPKTGIRSNAVYRVQPDDADPVDLLPDYCFAYALIRQGFIRADRLTAASLRARPFWDILADNGIMPGVANWPLTFPAQADLGYVVSDRFEEGSSSPLRLADAHAGDPTTAADIAREAFDVWQSRPWHDVLPSFAPGEPEPDGSASVRADRAYSEAVTRLNEEFAPRLTAVRYAGLDWLGHNHLREAQPELFGESAREPQARSVLDRYYAFVDAEIGRAAAELRPGDLLLVVSGFGMEPESLSKRLLAERMGWLLGWPARSGTHEHAPDGFLLAYGSNVEAGEQPRGTIVDLAPTVLFYLGLPVGRDMDGFVRTDLFQRSYTAEHPVSYITTYER
jgi:hypothetical protein